MPRPAGGKQCMWQAACSTAQQHTPSSSSPGKTGLLFVSRLIPQPRNPPPFCNGSSKIPFCNSSLPQIFATPFFCVRTASYSRHPAHSFRTHPARLAADRRKRTKFRPLQIPETTFSSLANRPLFPFPETFRNLFRGEFQNFNKYEQIILFFVVYLKGNVAYNDNH